MALSRVGEPCHANRTCALNLTCHPGFQQVHPAELRCAVLCCAVLCYAALCWAGLCCVTLTVQ